MVQKQRGPPYKKIFVSTYVLHTETFVQSNTLIILKIEKEKFLREDNIFSVLKTGKQQNETLLLKTS